MTLPNCRNWSGRNGSENKVIASLGGVRGRNTVVQHLSYLLGGTHTAKKLDASRRLFLSARQEPLRSSSTPPKMKPVWRTRPDRSFESVLSYEDWSIRNQARKSPLGLDESGRRFRSLGCTNQKSSLSVQCDAYAVIGSLIVVLGSFQNKSIVASCKDLVLVSSPARNGELSKSPLTRRVLLEAFFMHFACVATDVFATSEHRQTMDCR